MATPPDDSTGNEVDEFLTRIRELGEKTDREDELRAQQLEQEIAEGRRKRQALRAERARSLSPQKQPPGSDLDEASDYVEQQLRALSEEKPKPTPERKLTKKEEIQSRIESIVGPGGTLKLFPSSSPRNSVNNKLTDSISSDRSDSPRSSAEFKTPLRERPELSSSPIEVLEVKNRKPPPKPSGLSPQNNSKLEKQDSPRNSLDKELKSVEKPDFENRELDKPEVTKPEVKTAMEGLKGSRVADIASQMSSLKIAEKPKPKEPTPKEQATKEPPKESDGEARPKPRLPLKKSSEALRSVQLSRNATIASAIPPSQQSPVAAAARSPQHSPITPSSQRLPQGPPASSPYLDISATPNLSLNSSPGSFTAGRTPSPPRNKSPLRGGFVQSAMLKREGTLSKKPGPWANRESINSSPIGENPSSTPTAKLDSSPFPNEGANSAKSESMFSRSGTINGSITESPSFLARRETLLARGGQLRSTPASSPAFPTHARRHSTVTDSSLASSPLANDTPEGIRPSARQILSPSASPEAARRWSPARNQPSWLESALMRNSPHTPDNDLAARASSNLGRSNSRSPIRAFDSTASSPPARTMTRHSRAMSVDQMLSSSPIPNLTKESPVPSLRRNSPTRGSETPTNDDKPSTSSKFHTPTNSISSTNRLDSPLKTSPLERTKAGLEKTKSSPLDKTPERSPVEPVAELVHDAEDLSASRSSQGSFSSSVRSDTSLSSSQRSDKSDNLSKSEYSAREKPALAPKPSLDETKFRKRIDISAFERNRVAAAKKKDDTSTPPAVERLASLRRSPPKARPSAKPAPEAIERLHSLRRSNTQQYKANDQVQEQLLAARSSLRRSESKFGKPTKPEKFQLSKKDDTVIEEEEEEEEEAPKAHATLGRRTLPPKPKPASIEEPKVEKAPAQKAKSFADSLSLALARGPPPSKSSPSSPPGESTITKARTFDSSSLSTAKESKKLTHMTKSRAKGPKRRLPKSVSKKSSVSSLPNLSRTSTGLSDEEGDKVLDFDKPRLNKERAKPAIRKSSRSVSAKLKQMPQPPPALVSDQR